MRCMHRQRRVGIILIIIGICLPLITLPFLSGYSRDRGIFDNLYRVGIDLRKDRQADVGNQTPSKLEERERKTPGFSRFIPKRIPFRFFLVITLILLYLGIVKINASGRNQDGQFEKPK